jgi:flavin reductase (DIM6/NTAB) family NADH-FMN oxidoreductase RutF
MKSYRKQDLPVHEVRRFLEPGPIVLVTSAYGGRDNIMTMGWHTVLEFSPSLIGCMITSANYSHELIRKSGECVINIPEAHLVNQVVDIGNCSGEEEDKFAKFGLTRMKSIKVKAPAIRECHANFECCLHDRRMVKDYNFFIFKVVRARVAKTPEYPKTLHYRGNGLFMVAGGQISRASRFLPDRL